MFYREAGDFKTSYRDDGQTFPIRLDRWGYYAVLAVAFLVVPFVIDSYWANAVLVPFLIYAIAAIGLNILTGYAGQVSLGTGGFMAVGAYAVYKLMTAFPGVPIVIHIVLAGAITAIVGVLFGLPSLRIKGFYLAVATLAAQFFLVWLFNKVPWFYNYSASGQITAPERTILGWAVTGPATTASAKYLICLVFRRRSGLDRAQSDARHGRAQMDGHPRHGYRGRDHRREPPDRETVGLCRLQLFRRHRRGAAVFGLSGRGRGQRGIRHQQELPRPVHDHHRRAGQHLWQLCRRGFLVLLPVLLKNLLVAQLGWPTDLAAHIELMIVGALIIFFLIVEPHGLARLWALTKEKLRLWPFPH
jgi:branched-chain amino acid transport system permease protein